MFKLQTFGLLLAGLLTAAVVIGAALLIALDFGGAEGLARTWSSLSAPAVVTVATADPLGARLKGVGEIDLFTVVDVPDLPIKVQTGTAYANAHDLALGTVSSRWCYARRDIPNSSFQPTVSLGNQKGTQSPVLFQAANIAAAEAQQVGASPDALADMARRYCRFDG